jgi:hypothetical protein
MNLWRIAVDETTHHRRTGESRLSVRRAEGVDLPALGVPQAWNAVDAGVGPSSPLR